MIKLWKFYHLAAWFFIFSPLFKKESQWIGLSAKQDYVCCLRDESESFTSTCFWFHHAYDWIKCSWHAEMLVLFSLHCHAIVKLHFCERRSLCRWGLEGEGWALVVESFMIPREAILFVKSISQRSVSAGRIEPS